MERINDRIRYYRILRGMSQEELGKELGMKCSTYSQMERKGKITVDMAFAIAEKLNIDPDLIIYGYSNNESGRQKKIFQDTRTKEFTAMEKNIIYQFRILNSEKRKNFLEFIEGLHK